MNPVVEKLAAIEKEVAAIQPKIEPMSARIDALHQKTAAFVRQIADIAAETSAVKEEVDAAREGLRKIQSLISESKTESEQLAAGQEESIQRCETMTAVFGAAFQAVSQFFDAAQKMGLADQAKTVFPALPALPLPETSAARPLPDTGQAAPDSTSVPEAVPEQPVPVSAEAVPENTLENTPENTDTDVPFSESDFDAVSATTTPITETAPEAVPLPALPDVAAIPEPAEMECEHIDALGGGIDSVAEGVIETELEVAPLNLAVPALPETAAAAESSEDEQEIEDMLASMMTPVTTENVQS
jgi:regulator of replication initiation timing